MNNIITKSSFKALILLFLMHSYALQSMQMPWYQHCFNNGTGFLYRDNCESINMIQNVRGAGLLAYHRLTHKKVNLNQVLCSIKNQLTEFETWLITAEQTAFFAIKEKYHISDEIWQQYLAEVQHMKNIYTNGMRQTNPIVINDHTIPTEIMEMLTTLLEQNGINPHSIYIKMVSDKEKISTHKNHIAQARSFIEVGLNSTNFSHHYIPSVIEIFPQMIAMSTENKISYCAHEIQHLIQHHGLSQLILETYLKHYYGIEVEEFKKSPEYHKLSQIHEAQAEILSAIKNPHIAKCLKTMRKKSYYPDHLYEEHFFHLASIDMLWKVHEWLEFFHQDGFGKIRNEWFKKIAHYTDSLKQLVGC